jgi:hypothetical protein
VVVTRTKGLQCNAISEVEEKGNKIADTYFAGCGRRSCLRVNWLCFQVSDTSGAKMINVVCEA